MYLYVHVTHKNLIPLLEKNMEERLLLFHN